MFAGVHMLGEAPSEDCTAPGGFPDWLEAKVPEGDFDMISVAYYSPDSNYAPKRIGNYNLPLDESRVALNGPTRQKYVQKIVAPRSRFM